MNPFFRRLAIGIAVTSMVPLMLACGGGGGDEDSATASASSTPAANASPATTPALSASAVASLEARVAQAYRDNRPYMSRTTVDELQVKFAPETGLLTIMLAPLPTSDNSIGGPNNKFLGGRVNDALAITSHSSLTASKVVWPSFPEVKRLHVVVFTDFTLTNGTKVIEAAASTSVDRATGDKMNFDALKVTVGNDNKAFFCAADAYRFHVTIYPAITDKGCLTVATKGIIP